jgi:hypothetical protein
MGLLRLFSLHEAWILRLNIHKGHTRNTRHLGVYGRSGEPCGGESTVSGERGERGARWEDGVGARRVGAADWGVGGGFGGLCRRLKR